MDLNPSLLFGHVMHSRLFPARNSFSYKIFYMAFNLNDIPKLNNSFFFRFQKWAFMSFWNEDHGLRSVSNDPLFLKKWIFNVFKNNNLDLDEKDKIVLITMPRIFGYVFNPVSFWLCYGRDEKLKYVLVEVNNTFGETHSYICIIHENNNEEWVSAKKMFHVSPFLPRDGHYNFKFKILEKNLSFQIDYYDDKNQKQLVTLLTGDLEDMTKKTLLKAFWGYPLVTFRAVYLIHWQALILWYKRQKFYKKPLQAIPNLTVANPKD